MKSQYYAEMDLVCIDVFTLQKLQMLIEMKDLQMLFKNAPGENKMYLDEKAIFTFQREREREREKETKI